MNRTVNTIVYQHHTLGRRRSDDERIELSFFSIWKQQKADVCFINQINKSYFI
jgi:hypothetical protein